jgi:protein-S-isoprenylcysteine O-methyltransferase Ste14
VAYTIPGSAIRVAREFFFSLAVLLIYAGIALRFYAIHVLGAYFTSTVAIAPKQPVIEAGPYRVIRHPSYTGFLIALLGFGLSLTNWLSVRFLMVCGLVGFGYRIHVEEQVLQENPGLSYQEYMRRTKRLIPFVL